jgi:hypothetical protein
MVTSWRLRGFNHLVGTFHLETTLHSIRAERSALRQRLLLARAIRSTSSLTQLRQVCINEIYKLD